MFDHQTVYGDLSAGYSSITRTSRFSGSVLPLRSATSGTGLIDYAASLTTSRIPDMAASHIFKVVFTNQGKIYEIFARKVSHGALWGFVEVEELIFGEKSTVVVDPSEERIKAEFEGVKRTYLPIHSVLRIDEVRKQGVSKISPAENSNVTPFPVPVYTPGGEPPARK